MIEAPSARRLLIGAALRRYREDLGLIPADPGQITEWAFSPSLWSEIACASAGHALTSNEWQEHVRPGGPAMPSQLACGS